MHRNTKIYNSYDFQNKHVERDREKFQAKRKRRTEIPSARTYRRNEARRARLRQPSTDHPELAFLLLFIFGTVPVAFAAANVGQVNNNQNRFSDNDSGANQSHTVHSIVSRNSTSSAVSQSQVNLTHKDYGNNINIYKNVTVFRDGLSSLHKQFKTGNLTAERYGQALDAVQDDLLRNELNITDSRFLPQIGLPHNSANIGLVPDQSFSPQKQNHISLEMYAPDRAAHQTPVLFGFYNGAANIINTKKLFEQFFHNYYQYEMVSVAGMNISRAVPIISITPKGDFLSDSGLLLNELAKIQQQTIDIMSHYSINATAPSFFISDDNNILTADNIYGFTVIHDQNRNPHRFLTQEECESVNLSYKKGCIPTVGEGTGQTSLSPAIAKQHARCGTVKYHQDFVFPLDRRKLSFASGFLDYLQGTGPLNCHISNSTRCEIAKVLQEHIEMLINSDGVTDHAPLELRYGDLAMPPITPQFWRAFAYIYQNAGDATLRDAFLDLTPELMSQDYSNIFTGNLLLPFLASCAAFLLPVMSDCFKARCLPDERTAQSLKVLWGVVKGCSWVSLWWYTSILPKYADRINLSGLTYFDTPGLLIAFLASLGYDVLTTFRKKDQLFSEVKAILCAEKNYLPELKESLLPLDQDSKSVPAAVPYSSPNPALQTLMSMSIFRLLIASFSHGTTSSEKMKIIALLLSNMLVIAAPHVAIELAWKKRKNLSINASCCHGRFFKSLEEDARSETPLPSLSVNNISR